LYDLDNYVITHLVSLHIWNKWNYESRFS